MNELALFAGAGGGILGGLLHGWRTVAAVEIEDYPRRVLLQRQADGILPRFPIWDDVCTFDGKPWRGKVDVISGGFPCQDISSAGKGAGIDGARSGLWSEMARIIREVRPRFVFVENSPVLTIRGLGVVLGDLAEMGYDARWGVLGACDAGAPHKRDRIWIVAQSSGTGARNHGEETNHGNGGTSRECLQALRQDHRAIGTDRVDTASAGEDVAHANMHEWCYVRGIKLGRQAQSIPSHSGSMADPMQAGLEGHGGSQEAGSVGARRTRRNTTAQGGNGSRGWWKNDPANGATQPFVGRVANGVANRVDRLKAIGNGQVPAVAALAWQILGGPVETEAAPSEPGAASNDRLHGRGRSDSE